MTRRLTGIPRARLPTHGDFEESARISQSIRDRMIVSPNWARMSPAQREALQMIAFKLGRVLCGDPDHVDHYADIAGYAQLGARACKRRKR